METNNANMWATIGPLVLGALLGASAIIGAFGPTLRSLEITVAQNSVRLATLEKSMETLQGQHEKALTKQDEMEKQLVKLQDTLDKRHL